MTKINQCELCLFTSHLLIIINVPHLQMICQNRGAPLISKKTCYAPPGTKPFFPYSFWEFEYVPRTVRATMLGYSPIALLPSALAILLSGDWDYPTTHTTACVFPYSSGHRPLWFCLPLWPTETFYLNL